MPNIVWVIDLRFRKGSCTVDGNANCESKLQKLEFLRSKLDFTYTKKVMKFMIRQEVINEWSGTLSPILYIGFKYLMIRGLI